MKLNTSVTGRLALSLAATALLLTGAFAAESSTLRPPAVPLVAHDPYFSIWSPADKLTDADTVHWTGRPHRLTSLVRIDGKPFRVMGKEPAAVPALPQKSVEVLPTRTIYTFEGEGVRLTLTFMTPALPEDLDVLSRPVTYVTYELRTTDNRSREVRVYFDASAELCVNTPNQEVVWGPGAESAGDLFVLTLSAKDQPILRRKGDDLRIDWGTLALAAPGASVASFMYAVPAGMQESFVKQGTANGLVNPGAPAPAAQAGAALTLNFPKGVSSKPVSRWLLVAYDDEYSIQYMRKNLRPYWRRNGDDAAALLKKAAADYESLKQRCEKFDAEFMADLRRAGGEKYARIGALAYRQCFAAGKFVADANGQPISFCKENHSNGCIGTSDVFYPMAPQFLLFGPTLAKSFLVPFMNYAASDRWKFPFAPHDLGTYPHANGQVYGGGERDERDQMPVEETGNLLILLAAVAQMEGNADFAGRWWPTLERWAEYLKAKGFDPENQLCTDDFAGHMAHNVNLSAKAIVGLGAFGKLCELRGRPLTPSDGERVAKPGEGQAWTAKGAEYSKLAKEFAQRWVKEADDGDHFRLAFDKPGTWSQKYNLIWDRILGLNLFPAEVARKELAFYRKHQNRYGLPLDNRKDYTKLDWITWTATLTRNRADFEALIDPVFTFLNETPDRAPMPDWYQTKSAKKEGFTARPVVGGVFAELLYDQKVWKKWASRDQTKAANWAPMPVPPKITVIVPAADDAPATWSFTTVAPGPNWFGADYDTTSWQQGPSGFGTRETPGARVGTIWNSREIWLRRELDVPDRKTHDLQGWFHHDEDAEVYINGVLALRVTGYTSSYDTFPLTTAGKAAIKPGKNLVAIHCRQTGGGQYIDFGLVDVQ